MILIYLISFILLMVNLIFCALVRYFNWCINIDMFINGAWILLAIFAICHIYFLILKYKNIISEKD